MNIKPTVAGLWLLCGCASPSDEPTPITIFKAGRPRAISCVAEIPPPPGFRRVQADPRSFGAWLRRISLRPDPTVFLYNGIPKRDQSGHYAVLDKPIGKKDLQHCADALMRLRAEYLFAEKRYGEILFRDNLGRPYRWEGGDDSLRFARYLENVFGWCGTASLEKQLEPLTPGRGPSPGDVLVQGGFPGHAMMVLDVAMDSSGRTAFLLAQGYMPAQDIHIVKNPGNREKSPWYVWGEGPEIITPDWTFTRRQFRCW